MSIKTVTRHVWQDYIERSEGIRLSPRGKAIYELRSQTIKWVFIDAKEKHGMRYTNHRGLDWVSNWVRLKFAAMNLKKLAVWHWKRRCFLCFSFFFLAFQGKRVLSLA